MMVLPESPLKICLLAGEASGDLLGARLMKALSRKTDGAVDFIGIGGALMEQEGLSSLFPMKDLSVMGIAEILPRLPGILQRIEQTVRFIVHEKPDILITIDSPDFCFRVVKKIRHREKAVPKMIHYVAPSVWAWRPERARKVAALYDGIMCLFPFEPPYFEREGMKAAFTGHPALETTFSREDSGKLKENLGIPADAETLGILFGSRMGEINRVGPALREAAVLLARDNPGLHILSPTFPHLEREVKNLLEEIPCHFHLVTNPALKNAAFASMDKAIATSGTVGLELAVAGVPHVIAYKMNALTYALIKNKIRVRYAHLANILLNQGRVPEFIQLDCRGDRIAAAMKTLDIAKQRESFDKVRALLSGAEDTEPAGQAARFVLSMISV